MIYGTTDQALQKLADAIANDPSKIQTYQVTSTRGTGRIVYRSGIFAIKKARNISSGVVQNRSEFAVWNMEVNQHRLNKVRAISEDGSILIANWVVPVTNLEFRLNKLETTHNDEIKQILTEYKQLNKTAKIVHDYDEPSSWGKTHNGYVLIDYAIW